MLITFEGGDGAGKSTQISRLLAYLREKGHTVTLSREPGGEPIAERIRNLVLDPACAGMEPLTEALLYAAARAQHVRKTLRPALARGEIVLCDRFFDSSLAYQAYGRELGEAVIRQINEAAMDGLLPRRTYFLHLPPEEAMRRKKGEPDRIEREDAAFRERVQRGYQKIAAQSGGRILLLDATASPDALALEIRRDVDELLRGTV